MLKLIDVMAQECIYKEHAGRELLPQQIGACGCPSGQYMDHVTLGRMSLDSIILWTCWLIGNAQGLCYMSGCQDTMASVNGEVDDNRIPNAMCSHRLIKV